MTGDANDPGRARAAAPRRRRPSWRRRLLFALVATVGLTALGLGALELILRTTRGHLLGLPAQLHGMYSVVDGVVVATPGWRGEQTIEGRTTSIRLNRLGMRGPDPPAKAAAERRVLVLGDSFVWGYGVAEDEAFPSRLERRLDAAIERFSIRVGNAGLPAYGTRKQAIVLERVRAAFQPDAIVSCTYVGNDYFDDVRTYETVVDGYRLEGPVARLAESSWRARLALRSHVAFLVEQWLDRNLPALAFDRTQLRGRPEDQLGEAMLPPLEQRYFGAFLDARAATPGIDAVLANYRQSYRRLRQIAGDTPLLAVVIPRTEQMTDAGYDEWLRGLGGDPAAFERGLGPRRIAAAIAEVGVACLDLTPLLGGDDPPTANWQPIGKHFSVRGHQRVAEWLAPRVRELLER